MCVPCIIIASGCGAANEAAVSFIDSNEQFAEIGKYLADNGTLTEESAKLIMSHCEKYEVIANTLDVFRKETLALSLKIAKNSKNPHNFLNG